MDRVAKHQTGTRDPRRCGQGQLSPTAAPSHRQAEDQSCIDYSTAGDLCFGAVTGRGWGHARETKFLEFSFCFFFFFFFFSNDPLSYAGIDEGYHFRPVADGSDGIGRGPAADARYVDRQFGMVGIRQMAEPRPNYGPCPGLDHPPTTLAAESGMRCVLDNIPADAGGRPCAGASLPAAGGLPKPYRKGQKHARSTTPRPANAFILYRRDMASVFSKPDRNGARLRNGDISKVIASMWHSETEAIRESYYARAAEEKRRHSQMHPNYKYRPHRHDAQRRNRRDGKGDSARRSEELCRQPETSGSLEPPQPQPHEPFPDRMSQGEFQRPAQTADLQIRD
ncbi:MAG: hypothetical protein BJ554DRAFT_5080, partial [Olpidium bornovanus]